MTIKSMLQQQLRINKADSVLIYGIGNEGRQDDGIGIRMVSALEKMSLPRGWELDANYQLNAEVALQISNYQVVLFLDASRRELDSPFYVEEIEADNRIVFSTHAMSAASVLGLCEKLFSARPRCFYIGVPGKTWEFGEDLSAKAQANMSELLKQLNLLLEDFKAEIRTDLGGTCA